MSDLRLALRGMIKDPGPTSVVLLTLAVAISVSTVVYSTIDLVWHMIPARNTERLVFISSTDPRPSQSQSGMSGGVALTGTSVPDLVDWSARSTTVEEFGAFTYGTATLTGLNAPLRVSTVRATGNLPSLWELGVVLGRAFTAGESRPGAAPVVMLTHAFWERELSSSPEVLGRGILLNGTPHTIIGVLAPEAGTGIFARRDLMVPLPLDPARFARDERRLYVTARLKEGVTRARASAEMDAIAMRLRTEHPRTNAQTGVVVRPLIELIWGETPFVLSLLALAAVMVVAIACANISNMILARASARQHELALRTALGATRFHHVRALMVQSSTLSIAAGAVGLLFASWGIAGIRWFTGPDFAQLAVNGRVLIAAAVASFIAPFAFALLPALRSSRTEPVHLREGSRAIDPPSGRRIRNVLVGAQVALAVILMVQMVLVGRTASRFRTAAYGFDPGHVLTFRVDLSQAKYPDAPKITQFYEDFLRRIEGLPGVASAAAVNRLPIGDRELSVRLAIEGTPSASADELPFAALTTITRDYFSTLEVPVLRGRAFTDADFRPGPPVAMVSEEAARRLWNGADPIGTRVTLNAPSLPDTPLVIVGVVANPRDSDLDQRVMPQIYVPSSWHPDRARVLVVRTVSADPLQFVPAIRAQAAQIDPDEPIFAVASMEQVLFDDLSGTYTIAGLLAAVAFVALWLAAAGIYGVVSYSVNQRTREIGVRMALGAQRGEVLQMIIGKGALPVLVGAGVGLLAALGLAYLMSASAGLVEASDPRSYGGVMLSMLLVAFVASYLPARRASQVDPLVALRE